VAAGAGTVIAAFGFTATGVKSKKQRGKSFAALLQNLFGKGWVS
jgi:hypothetical protein